MALFAFTIPIVLWFVPERRAKTFRLLLMAIGISVLVASPFLAAFADFFPLVSKDFDLEIPKAQALSHLLLNFVVAEREFYGSRVLNLVHAAANASPVGWIAVVGAVIGIIRLISRGGDVSGVVLIIFFGGSALLASGLVQRFLYHEILPQDFSRILGGIRYPQHMLPLATIPLLTLAAIGLGSVRQGLRGMARQLYLMGFLALGSLEMRDLYEFNSSFLHQNALPPEVLPTVQEVVNSNPSSWIGVPGGESFWMIPLIERGEKIANNFYHTWQWRDGEDVSPSIRIGRRPVNDHSSRPLFEQQLFSFRGDEPGGIQVGTYPAHYSRLRGVRGVTPCRARSEGGDVLVVCPGNTEGILELEERFVPGWRCESEGRSLRVSGPMIRVEGAPFAGPVECRYRPPRTIGSLVISLVTMLFSVTFLIGNAVRRLPRG
jgi:hypothetical protein